MVSELFFYQLALIVLLWLCCLLHWVWPSDCPTGPAPLPQPTLPRRKRRCEPTPSTGLTTKPHCDACTQASACHPRAPSAPPPPIVMTRGRRRQIDTATHFCPNPDCRYHGGVGWGNLRANGHPNGGPWRQLLCVAWRRYFLETLGTLFHGKHASADLIVRVITCLAEGLGIRGTARVFEVDPNTVLQWLVEAAEQLRAFSQHFLHDMRVQQVQLDELFALLSAVKHGEVSEADAIERLERSPQWVWVAMDPESKLLLAIDVGNRTLAMAQRFVHQVAQVLAPDCAPLFLTDGFREYLTALLTHYGQWVQPPRARPQVPLPKPRWMPLPQLLYAQVVKTVRRRRLVRRAAPRGVWHAGGRQSRARPPGLAHQHGLRGADQPHHPAACGRGRATGQHAVQGRRWVAAAIGRVPLLLQFLFAPYECAPALPPARADPRQRLSHAVAALDAGHGGGAHRPCLDPA